MTEIKTGLIEASRKANPAERDYAKWAESRGLWVACEYGFDEHDRTVPLLTLGIDEMIDGKIHSFMTSPVGGSEWPEAREADEALLRAGFERYKTRQTQQYRDAEERIARAFGFTPGEVRDAAFEQASDEAHALRTVFLDAIFDQAHEIADRLAAEYLAEHGS